MPFTIDKETLLIKGRKGDTASFTFDLNQDISSYTVSFYVKKNLESDDSVITKSYSNLTTESATFNLTSDDTSLLESKGNSYAIYYWGIKISDGIDYVQTIIPNEFEAPPMMYIYPNIGD